MKHWYHWLKYVFTEPTDYAGKKPPTWTQVWCRMKGHPSGPVFYNVGGAEPDWKCQDCGELLA